MFKSIQNPSLPLSMWEAFQKNHPAAALLKDKVGNRSNSSSEVEFEDAYGVLMGEEGRGIPTIIEMATYTRLNCVVGSAAMLRQGVVQAIAYTRQRHAFAHPAGQKVDAGVRIQVEVRQHQIGRASCRERV